MAWINYHHLYYFYVIAQEGGVAKAAKKLRLGQPTLSTQLKSFEEALGHNLFERSHRTMTLTESGKIAFDYAQEIFRLGEEMFEVLGDRPSGKKVHVQIGALDGVPKSILRQLFEAARKAGDCYVSILEGPGDFLLRELLAHRIDLVVTNTPAPLAPRSQCKSRLIGESPVVVFGTSAFSKLKKGFPASLSGAPFVLPTEHSKLRFDLEHFFESRKLQLRTVAETQDTSVQKLIVGSGQALGAISANALAGKGTRGDFVILGALPGIKEQLWVSAVSRKIKNPIADALFESFRPEI